MLMAAERARWKPEAVAMPTVAVGHLAAVVRAAAIGRRDRNNNVFIIFKQSARRLPIFQTQFQISA